MRPRTRVSAACAPRDWLTPQPHSRPSHRPGALSLGRLRRSTSRPPACSIAPATSSSRIFFTFYISGTSDREGPSLRPLQPTKARSRNNSRSDGRIRPSPRESTPTGIRDPAPLPPKQTQPSQSLRPPSRTPLRSAVAPVIPRAGGDLGHTQPAPLFRLRLCYGESCPALRPYPALVAICALAYPPLFHFFVRGQNSALVLACFTAAYLALRAKRNWLAGIALGS